MARICLIATGGTRAPTLLDLAERFDADGHELRLIATRNALHFLRAHLLRNPRRWPLLLRCYRYELWEKIHYYIHKPKQVPHISEGKWCDVMVVAPATSNSVGKIAGGLADNYAMLSIRALPRTKKCLVVPSMNPEMWYDPAFQRNIDFLNQTRKYRVLAPSRGKMLSGDWGIGAQANFDDIVDETYRTLGLTEERPALATVPDDQPDHRVLVVDRDPAGFSMLDGCLRRDYGSFQLEHCTDADAALGWLSEHHPALVLIEVDLDESNGSRRVIRDVRARHGFDVPIIAVSARARHEVQAEVLAQDDVLFLPKPFNVEFATGLIGGSVLGQKTGRSAVNARVIELEPGQVLFEQGDPGELVYRVRSGMLRVLKESPDGPIQVAEIGPGAMVGELAYLTEKPRAATVQATEHTELTELDLGAMRDYVGRQPAWMQSMIQSLGDHLKREGANG
jgi:CheY-like chemotaxis protein